MMARPLMWNVGRKMPKIGPSGQVILSLESRPSSKVKLMP
jgi:hypothetical protein